MRGRETGVVDPATWDLFGRIVEFPVDKIMSGERNGARREPTFSRTLADRKAKDAWRGRVVSVVDAARVSETSPMSC